MYKSLTDAESGTPLIIEKMTDNELAMRLGRIGLFEGSEIMRLDEEVLVQPVRIRGPRRDVVLGGGMAMKIVVHLDDGRKLPLVEMKPGETGHIEGLTGSTEFVSVLEKLELEANDLITLIRKIPPMEYITVVIPGERVRLTEGMAAKIWGSMQGRNLQFVSARAGQEFKVEDILGGFKARKMLHGHGIEPGRTLVLETVAQAQSLHQNTRNPIIIVGREGLRLFLRPEDGEHISVRQIMPGS
jgi:Fe2+ transport system protein FeoA